MSVAASIKLHLPMMRRYARALTGSTKRGDAHVALVLEALLADPDALPVEWDLRLGIYRMLSSILPSFGEDTDKGKSPHAWENIAYHRFSTVLPVAKQAFVLVMVEEVSLADTAWILELDEAEVRALLASVFLEIAMQISTDVLMLEDEPMIAIELEQMIRSIGHTVIGIARNYREALANYSRVHPGLVIADIQLADGTSGIDAANEMLGRTRDAPPIVFVSAYPQRLLTVERPEPTFLITKPYQKDMVMAIISQALFFDGVPEAVA